MTTLVPSGSNRIVVDWDGTCVENLWPKMGDWLPGAVDALHALVATGREVVILSTRLAKMKADERTPRELEEWQGEVVLVRAMLDVEGLEDVGIWFEPWKPGAEFYIDDKAVRFNGDWAEVVEQIIGRTRTPAERAVGLVRGARQADYGHPLDNHERIADFWTTRLGAKLVPGVRVEPHEAASMMRLVKEARLMQTPGHQDSLDDLAGYSDVEWEIHREARRRSAVADEVVEALHAAV